VRLGRMALTHKSKTNCHVLPLYHDMGHGFALEDRVQPPHIMPTEAFVDGPTSVSKRCIKLAARVCAQLRPCPPPRARQRPRRADLGRVPGRGLRRAVSAKVMRDFAGVLRAVVSVARRCCPAARPSDLAITFHPRETRRSPIAAPAMPMVMPRPRRHRLTAAVMRASRSTRILRVFQGDLRIIDSRRNLPERRVGQIVTRTRGRTAHTKSSASRLATAGCRPGLGYLADGTLYICGRIRTSSSSAARIIIRRTSSGRSRRSKAYAETT
jgi:hypothetical protein